MTPVPAVPASATKAGLTTSEILLGELVGMLEPLAETLEEDPEELERLLENAGVDPEEVESVAADVAAQLGPVADAWATIDDAFVDPLEAGEIPDLGEFGEIKDAIAEIVAAIRDLDDLSLPDVEVDRFGKTLLEYLIVRHLDRRHPVVADTLRITGVIVSEGGVPAVEFGRVPDLLTDVNAAAADALEWGTEHFDAILLLEYLHALLEAWDLPAWLGPVPIDRLTDVLAENQELIEALETFDEEEILEALGDLAREGVLEALGALDEETFDALATLADEDAIDALAAVDPEALFEALRELDPAEVAPALEALLGVDLDAVESTIEDLIADSEQLSAITDLLEAFDEDEVLEAIETICNLAEGVDDLQGLDAAAIAALVPIADEDVIQSIVDGDLDDLLAALQALDQQNVQSDLESLAEGAGVDLDDVEREIEDALDDNDQIAAVKDLLGEIDEGDVQEVIETVTDLLDGADDLQALDEAALSALLPAAAEDLIEAIANGDVDALLAALQALDQQDVRSALEALLGVDLGAVEAELERWIDDDEHLTAIRDFLAELGIEDAQDLVEFVGDLLEVVDELGETIETVADGDLEDTFALLLEVVEALLGADLDPKDVFADLPTIPTEVTITVFEAEGDDGSAEAGISILALPGENGALPGIALVPYGELAYDSGVDLGPGWTFNVDVSGGFGEWGVVFRPDESGVRAELRSFDDGGSPPGTAYAEAALEFDAAAANEAGSGGDGADDEVPLLAAGGATLSVTAASVEALVTVDDGDFVLKVTVPASGRITVDGSEFDSFIGDVLGDSALQCDFDVVVGWSSAGGLFFERGGNLEVSLPTNARLGPVELKETFLGAGPATEEGDAIPVDGSGDGAAGPPAQPGEDDADELPFDVDAEVDADAEARAIAFTGAVSGSVELGPVEAVITRIGIDAELSFPKDGDGDLGPLAFDVSLKPPDGIGLVVESEGVKGGGYLYLDRENERYAGLVQLYLEEIRLDAIGLLTTRMPDGGDGFSLLIVITADVPPINVGMGFVIDAVGGLVGVHRKMNRDALQDAVAAGSLDSVLFPSNPVENADRIISDLRSIFPPERDQHVFGPMIRIGWGSPPLLFGDLGIVLQVPSTEIAILGRIGTLLPPKSDEPIVDLKADVLGFIDADGVSIDATLKDSFIGPIDVDGDVAIRIGWGDSSRFIVSVGGFHPDYRLPSGVDLDADEVDRIRASTSFSGGSVEIRGYFALTSNTVQIGGGAEAELSLGPASVGGKIEFDALIYFDPFEFTFRFSVEFWVKIWGMGFSPGVSGTISGPNPYHVRGKVTVSTFLKDFTKRFDKKFGPNESVDPLPSARILPALLEELEAPENWRDPTNQPVVSLRDASDELDDEDGPAELIHPLGRLAVSQQLIPLERELELFEKARPAKYDEFAISRATLAPAAHDPDDLERIDVYEEFAPADFEEMTDDERLTAPSFEEFVAGAELAVADAYRGGENASTRRKNARRDTLEYETVIRDRSKGNLATPLWELGRYSKLDPEEAKIEARLAPTIEMVRSFDDVGAVATDRLRAEGPALYTPTVSEPLVDPVEEGAAGGPVGTGAPAGGSAAGGSTVAGSGSPVGDAFRTNAPAGGKQIESVGGRTVGGPAFAEEGAEAEGMRVMSMTTDDGGSESSGGGSGGGSTASGGLAGRLSVSEPRYVVVNADDLTPARLDGERFEPASKRDAERALSKHLQRRPGRSGRYRVVRASRARDAPTEDSP